ncbi:BadF/BadG/BcrA/BcrD ATPase family protein [Asticcacaulis sp. ZE23SCel15]|uniref:BadF/BadG/BcrA/BcrD ATPase family protein n=1 Tax=Asticcacaulis sp. ZE23SCel15 TaxID=3059027 RepID=UPI00265DDB22|nr:BadF/BadG/BcrA/BcrD ATPase family protein [Asticcacaulis sp. ZE23SCel15]WKL56081.1 BadF/BadG/BcrA/BcrD ATPase family protein [Asticcacaulis sp. ZE23SCel15]
MQDLAPPPLYYIGIDGGGTRCRARLKTRAGQTLSEGYGGASNIRLGLGLVWSNIMAAVDEALAKAELTHADLPDIHIGLGLAGISSPTGAQVTIDSGPNFGAIRASSDAHAACLGAFSGKDGAILISGTGSAGYIFNNGIGRGIGGWGFEVGDDGSAAGLGREALRAALRGYDKIAPSTDFTQEIIASFGGHAADVIAFVDTATPSDYGALAPLIMSYAEQGDPVAVGLVKTVASEIGLYLQRLHALGAAKIALVGGLSEPIRPWLSGRDAALLSEPESDAVEGALLLAQGAGTGLGGGIGGGLGSARIPA